MDEIYQINPKLDIPIYQQLVDCIRAAVKKGELAPKEQLPTVQELSLRLSIARGTIKRAYDELERLGLVEKVQGRGTFVSYQPLNAGSRKEQAMAAIDTMLDKLEAMGLPPAEINIFLNLKLRERAEQESRVKVAVVECNPENLSQMSEQLHGLKNVDLYAYLVESIQQYPYKIGEDMDLVVTTAEHGGFLEKLLPLRRRIARVALRLTADCLSEIIRLRKGKTVGILCYSTRFGDLLLRTCGQYTEGVTLQPPQVFSQDLDPEAFLKGKDAVLVPRGYEKYCSDRVAKALDRFPGKLIECSYELDEGSFLYLREKTKRLLEEKTGGGYDQPTV